MRVLFHLFSLGAAQTPFALSAQSLRKKPKNHAKLVFLVQKNVIMDQKKTNISRTSNIAILLDWAQMSDLDFGLIRQKFPSKRLHSIIKGALFLWKVTSCD